MTLIDKAEALEAVHEADSLELVQHGASRIAERIAAIPARGVGVKPLVWQFEQEDVQVANTSARHQYRVIHDRRATNGAWSWFCDGAWIGCETEEAAKAAAQADYEARIFAALAPTDAAQAEDSYPYDGPEQCERDLEDTAAQAREAAMQELIDAYSDIIDYGPLVLARKDQWKRVEAAKEKLK